MQKITQKPSWTDLKDQLRHFGLNPDHWRLKWQPQLNIVELKNRQNPHLRLQGHVHLQGTTAQWLGLELIGA